MARLKPTITMAPASAPYQLSMRESATTSRLMPRATLTQLGGKDTEERKDDEVMADGKPKIEHVQFLKTLGPRSSDAPCATKDREEKEFSAWRCSIPLERLKASGAKRIEGPRTFPHDSKTAPP